MNKNPAYPPCPRHKPESNPPTAFHQAEKEAEVDLLAGLKLPRLHGDGNRLGRRALKAILVRARAGVSLLRATEF